ncbi:MAG: sigma-70 family RNA polymerase sigma factor [Alphaproteobacteria bacterium]|nr:sigma-70 family RNA polymerase sigma factor [Alphaproteobacteria bacterium]
MTAGAPGLDRAALEALYVRLERPMVNVVLRWTWEPEEAQEIVQEAFLRVWRMRVRVRPDTVEALLWRVALNLASKRRRWRAVRSFFTLAGLSAGEPSPGERLDDAGRARRVRAAVEALPERQRQVVMLSAFSGLSYKEIGDILGVPEGTVASRRHHALARLRAALEDGRV